MGCVGPRRRNDVFSDGLGDSSEINSTEYQCESTRTHSPSISELLGEDHPNSNKPCLQDRPRQHKTKLSQSYRCKNDIMYQLRH